jgi:hypothetical protein
MAARRYGCRPSDLLSSDPTDLAIDLATALRANNRDFEYRSGDWWYLTILELLGVKIPRADGTTSNTTVTEWVTL